MRRLASVMLCAALLVPGAAWADGDRFRDPDEQPFCESPDPCPDSDYIDFDRASHGHGPTDRVLQHGLHTRERWKTKDMGGRHGVTIYFDFDVNDNKSPDRRLRIRRKDGELLAQMYRGKYFRKKIGEPVRAWRPDRRSIKVRFRVRLLGDDVDGYRWRASWYNRALACPGSCHSDSAPHRGWFEHTL